jgi:hypothetical protein
MSWLSKKTGRPEEDGGHKRIDVSLDVYTRDVLDCVENRSKLIEYCVSVFVQPKWVTHHEPKVTINYDSLRFIEGAAFEFIPRFNPSNAVLMVNCYFDFSCENSGVAFRVFVNGKKGLRLVEHSSGSGYSCSCVYDENKLGFEDMGETFYNQERYVFKFEFKPLKPSVVAYVKDVHLSVQVVENPLLNEGEPFTRFGETLKRSEHSYF